jgi:hypothetical protein
MERHGGRRAVPALPERCPYAIDQVVGDWEPGNVVAQK